MNGIAKHEDFEVASQRAADFMKQLSAEADNPPAMEVVPTILDAPFEVRLKGFAPEFSELQKKWGIQLDGQIIQSGIINGQAQYTVVIVPIDVVPKKES